MGGWGSALWWKTAAGRQVSALHLVDSELKGRCAVGLVSGPSAWGVFLFLFKKHFGNVESQRKPKCVYSTWSSEMWLLARRSKTLVNREDSVFHELSGTASDKSIAVYIRKQRGSCESTKVVRIHFIS